jgi:tRNA nucleotidyltransferase (CCA-adding enzyme)
MFVEKLNNLPNKSLRLLKQIGKLAHEDNYKAFIVGGVVRDIFLRRENLDFDIIIEGDGIAFAKKLSKKLKAQLIQHERFYTSRLTIANGLKIDIATARSESYEYPGALPRVIPGKIEDDLARRDFSINAMAIDLGPGNFGRLIDFFNGLEDLKNKKVRVLHDLSFVDDPTRILRAIRFEQRFKFRIESHTYDLIKKALRNKVFNTVKSPRIWQELVLILKENKPKRYIVRLSEVCGLSFIHPKLKLDRDKIKLLGLAERAINYYKRSYPHREPLDAWLMYFMVLVERLKLSEIKKIIEKFNLRKQERKKIYAYRNLDKNLFNFLDKKNLRPSQIYIVLEQLNPEALILLRMKLRSKIAKKRIDNFLKIYSEVKLSINGHDINELGVSLDNHFKNILDKVFYKKLDGELKSKQDELEYAKELVDRL